MDIKSNKNSVYISVTDNGIGEDISKLKKYLDGDVDGDSQEHTSIGLRNINERIHLLFGSDYGLTFEHTDVMKVIIHIPEIREEVKHEEKMHVDC